MFFQILIHVFEILKKKKCPVSEDYNKIGGLIVLAIILSNKQL